MRPSLRAVAVAVPLLAVVLAGCGHSRQIVQQGDQAPAEPTRVITEAEFDSVTAQNKLLKDQLAALATENRNLTGRITELEARLQPAPAMGAPVDMPRQSAPTPAAPISTADKRAQYEDGVAMVRKKDFKAAIQRFEDLLSHSVGPELADNCHYWIGESYFALKRYDLAATEFNTVLEFRMSEKTNDAMYMLGQTLAAQGKADEAVKTYNDLIKRAPETALAKKAKAKLTQMGR